MEIWDIYDKFRNKTGRFHEREKKIIFGDYHIVVHVWIQNIKGEILLTKRHPSKTYPNLWESTGGSVIAGESSIEGAIREVKEEIGININKENGKLIKSERRDELNDFYDVWLFKEDINLEETVLQEGEVTDIKWVNNTEFNVLLEKGEIVDYLSYFKKFF